MPSKLSPIEKAPAGIAANPTGATKSSPTILKRTCGLYCPFQSAPASQVSAFPVPVLTPDPTAPATETARVRAKYMV